MSNTLTRQILCRTTTGLSRSFILFREFHPGNRVLSRPRDAIAKAFTDKFTSATKQFDNVLGIAEVRAAQSGVEKAEDTFMKSRRNVEATRTHLVQLQTQLRDLRSKLDRIPREDERYLQLATQEHKVLIEERKLKTDLEGFVAHERDNFAALSAAVRNAHERERSRAERTKYWSIIGSACGAVLGILGSTGINMKRMKQIKLTVEENNQAFMAKTMEELKIILQSENVEMMSTGDTSLKSLSTDSNMHISKENNKLLTEVCAKLERFSESDFQSVKSLALAVQGLKQDISKKLISETEHVSYRENSSEFRDFQQQFCDVSWWSKASMLASVTSVSCSLLLYFLYR